MRVAFPPSRRLRRAVPVVLTAVMAGSFMADATLAQSPSPSSSPSRQPDTVDVVDGFDTVDTVQPDIIVIMVDDLADIPTDRILERLPNIRRLFLREDDCLHHAIPPPIRFGPMDKRVTRVGLLRLPRLRPYLLFFRIVLRTDALPRFALQRDVARKPLPCLPTKGSFLRSILKIHDTVPFRSSKTQRAKTPAYHTLVV